MSRGLWTAELPARCRDRNGIAPGAILWPENGMDQTEKENILSTVPLAKKGTAEDIAKAIFDLQSSNYITGQIIAVDGGRSLSW